METQIIGSGTQLISGTTTDGGKNFTGGLLQIHEAISGWEVASKINAASGEADLYIAQKGNAKGVVKYYRSAIKPKTAILDKIKGLNHPDIINVFEYGYYHDRFYEIMEYAAGGSLDTRDPDGTYVYLPLSEDKATDVCKEVLNAYKTCHEKGIIHRDIKPANLYYRNVNDLAADKVSGSDIVIADFGISSIMDETEKANIRKTQTASRTTGYAAPEVLSGIITSKMDYYALGITLWELLTGKDPFVREDGKRRNEAHLIRDTIEGRIADDLLSRDPKLSDSMQRLIRGLLVVDEKQRWGYDEVMRHLNGERVEVFQKQKKVWTFTIGGTTCTSLEQLGKTLIENPEVSQKYVFRGLIGNFLEDDYPDIAKSISTIVDESSAKNDYHNGILRVAYLLNPGMPLKLGNGFSVSNIEDVVFLIENAPETMLPLLKDHDSKLYIWLGLLGYDKEIADIQALPASSIPDIEFIDKGAVILKHYTINPFKLEKYADFELSDLEQIRRVPENLQNHILTLVAENSHEGLFVPWLDILTPEVTVSQMETDDWDLFLESIHI
jgi:serine/threonine protein kinase